MLRRLYTLLCLFLGLVVPLSSSASPGNDDSPIRPNPRKGAVVTKSTPNQDGPVRLPFSVGPIAYKPLKFPLVQASDLLTRFAMLGPDPIRFTMTASKDSVRIGEEFELTITAELLNIPSQLLFSFEDQKAYTIKVITPAGFVQTGGDYVDFMGGDFRNTSGKWSYTLRGKFTSVTADCFTLLRGGFEKDKFVRKNSVCISTIEKINNYSVSSKDTLRDVKVASAKISATTDKPVITVTSYDIKDVPSTNFKTISLSTPLSTPATLNLCIRYYNGNWTDGERKLSVSVANCPSHKVAWYTGSTIGGIFNDSEKFSVDGGSNTSFSRQYKFKCVDSNNNTTGEFSDVLTVNLYREYFGGTVAYLPATCNTLASLTLSPISTSYLLPYVAVIKNRIGEDINDWKKPEISWFPGPKTYSLEEGKYSHAMRNNYCPTSFNSLNDNSPYHGIVGGEKDLTITETAPTPTLSPQGSISREQEEAVTLTASNCPSTVRWKKGENLILKADGNPYEGSFYIVPAREVGTFKAICRKSCTNKTGGYLEKESDQSTIITRQGCGPLPKPSITVQGSSNTNFDHCLIADGTVGIQKTLIASGCTTGQKMNWYVRTDGVESNLLIGSTSNTYNSVSKSISDKNTVYQYYVSCNDNPCAGDKSEPITIVVRGQVSLSKSIKDKDCDAVGQITVAANTTSDYEFKLGSSSYQNSGTFTGLNASAYTITARNKSCGDSPTNDANRLSTIDFTITDNSTSPPSNPELTQTGTKTLKNDESIQVTANGCSYTVFWFKDGTRLTGDRWLTSTQTIYWYESGKYTTKCHKVCSTNPNGYIDSDESDALTIAICEKPNAPTITATRTALTGTETAVLSTQNCSGQTVYWNGPGVSQNTTGSAVTVSRIGTYWASCAKTCAGIADPVHSNKSNEITISNDTDPCKDEMPTTPTISFVGSGDGGIYTSGNTGRSRVLQAQGCNGTIYWYAQGNNPSIGQNSPFEVNTVGIYYAICVKRCERTGDYNPSAPSNLLDVYDKGDPCATTVKPNAPALSTNPADGVLRNSAQIRLSVTGCSDRVNWYKENNFIGQTQAKYLDVQSKGTYSAACVIACPAKPSQDITSDQSSAREVIDPSDYCTKPDAPKINVDLRKLSPGEKATLTATGCETGRLSWSGPNIDGRTEQNLIVTATGDYKVNCTIDCFGPITSNYSETISIEMASLAIVSTHEEVYYGQPFTLRVVGCDKGVVRWTRPNGTIVDFANPVEMNSGPGWYRADCFGAGFSTQATKFIEESAAQVADITADREYIFDSEYVNLVVTGCTVNNIEWELAGLTVQNFQTSTNQNTFRVQGAGTFRARCRTSDNPRGLGPWSTVVVGLKTPAVVDITANKDSANIGEPVLLTGSGCTVTYVQWQIAGKYQQVGVGSQVVVPGPGTYYARCYASDRSVGPWVSYKVRTARPGKVTIIPSRYAVSPDETVTLKAENCPNGIIGWIFPSRNGLTASEPLTGNPVDGVGPGEYKAYCIKNGYTGPVASITIAASPTDAPRFYATKSSVRLTETADLLSEGCPNNSVQWRIPRPGGGYDYPVGRIIAVTGPAVYSGRCLSGPYSSWVDVQIFPAEQNALRLTANKSSAKSDEEVIITAYGCNTGTIRWMWGENSPVGKTEILGQSQLTKNGPGTYKARCEGDPATNGSWVQITIHPTDLNQFIPSITLSKSNACPDEPVTITAAGCPAGYSVQLRYVRDEALAYWKDNRIVAEYQSTFDLPIFAYGNSPLTLNGPRTVWARCFKVDGSYTGDFREKSATVDPRIFDDFYVSSNGPLQVGQKLLVGATLVDGGTYSWTGPDGFNSSAGRVINIEHVTLANAGLYKVTVTAGTGGATCSKTAEVNVVVKNCDLNIQASYVDNNGKNVIVTDFPAEGISVVPPLTLKALDLTNRPFQKTDVNLLKWTFNGSELTKVDSLLISPNSTLTTYTIARTDKAGCTDQVAVKLKPVACSTLVATATPNTLLMGQQTILTVNNTLGKAGNGLVMDGATNTFTTNQQPNLALHSNFTWEAWVKPGKPRSLNAENENYALYPSYQANTNDAGRTGMGVAVGTDGITVVEHGPNLLRGIVALDMDINQWTHVAITYTNNLPRIYVNGKLRATANTSSGRVAMPGLGVGGGDDNRYGRFKGSIDEVRIWNTPRSAQQISADYYKTFETANLPAGLVTYWNFDNAANGTATAILPANVAAGLGGATVADGALLIEEDRQLTTAYEWSLNGSVLANTATLLHEPQQSGTYQVRCINCQTACATSVAVTVTRFDGCFRLAAKHSGKVMYPGLDNTIKVQPLNTDSKDQVWALQPAGSGSFRLISAVNGKAVQYYNGSSLSLVPVSQTLAQQFTLVPQAEANTYRLDPLDLVNIDANNPLATPQPHSVEATDDGLWAPLTTGGTNQFFVLTPATCPFTLPADCGIRLVATDATGKETDRLPRKAGTTDQFDPLTIRAESLGDTPLTGALYSWSLASGAPSNASSLTATQRGVYSLTLSAAGQTSVCQTNITLSATPCSSQTAPYGECKNVNLTAPANTVGTARLFVGDSFNAGDYVVRITDLSGGASGWSGKGTVSMTLFGGLGLPVSVIFANAVINDCLEMVGGSVTTQYDPAWSNIVPIDLFTDLFKDLSDQLKAAYQNYKGSDADKVKIRELNTRYEAALADDALTEEQKQRLKAEYDAYKQQSEALLNCTQPTGCPTADQLSQRVDDLQKIADDIAEENKPNPNALRSGKLPAIAEQTLSGGRGNACQESVRLTTNLTIQFLNNKCWLKSDGYLEIDGVKYVVVWKDDEPPTQFLGFYRLDYMRKNACSNPTSETIATVDKKANYPICQQGWYPPSGYKKVFDLSPINTILAADVAGNSAVKLLRESGLLSKDQNTVGNSVSNRYTILVSDYTFSPTDLEVIAQKANNPGSDEIILWIHFPTQNVATTKYQWFLGTNIKRKMTPATTEWTALLDGWIQNLAKVAHNQHVPSFEKVISNIVVSLGQVQVPAEFWDCTSPDYSPIMATIYASDEERLKFAYKCGLFRGVMGQIAGTADAAVTLSKFQNELPRFLLDITFNKDNIREELRAKVSRMLSLGPIKDMYDNLVLQHTSKTSCALAEQVGKDVVDVVAVALAVRSAVKLGAQGLSQLMTRITDDIAPLVAPYRNIPKVYFPDKGGFDITPGRTTPPGTPPSPGSGGMLVELKAPSIGTRPVAHFAIRQAQPMPAEQLAMNRQIAKSVGAKTPAAVAAEGELLTEQLPGRVYEMGSDGGSYSTYVDLGKGRLYKIRAAKPAPATGMVDVVVAVEEGKPAVQPLATSDGGVVVATLTKDGDCDLCKQRTQNDQDLCDKVTAVAAKATNQTKAKQAMEEFCKQPIAELPTSDLKSIVGQLQSDVTARSLTTFSQDVISRTSREAAFANNLSKFRDRQVAGWLILEEALTTYPQDDNGSDAILRKTYDAILYATEAYNFLHADRDRVKSRMVNKLRSGNVSKFAYLTSLAAIATTSDPNDPAITKLAPTRAAAFEIALNSDGCSGDFAVPGTTVDADFTQNPAMLTIQAARDDARKTYRGAPTGVNMNKISLESEKAGMLAADLFFTVSDGYRPLACEVPGGGKQGEFDRVFGKYDGQGRLLELVIVECKGGSSTLGCRNRNQQGSTKYLLDVVDYMNSQVPNDNSLLRQTTDLLLVNVGKIRGVKVPVRYMLINQAFNEGGDLKKALVTHFILNQSLFE